MATVSTSLVLTRNHRVQPSGVSLKPVDLCLGSAHINISSGMNSAIKLQSSVPRSKKPQAVQAAYRDDGRQSNLGLFVGGFVLGGLIVGALGCLYAPQISKALAGADKKDLMRKLPKFIYDEEKALEKTRKILAEKIAQLNSAIDDVSSQLRTEDTPDGESPNSDEVEAAI